MVQPQMDRDQFRNISNVDLVEPNQIRDSIYACIRLLFANFLALKMLQHAFNDARYSSDADSDVNYFLFAGDVKCGLYENKNKNNKANAALGEGPVQ